MARVVLIAALLCACASACASAQATRGEFTDWLQHKKRQQHGEASSVSVAAATPLTTQQITSRPGPTLRLNVLSACAAKSNYKQFPFDVAFMLYFGCDPAATPFAKHTFRAQPPPVASCYFGTTGGTVPILGVSQNEMEIAAGFVGVCDLHQVSSCGYSKAFDNMHFTVPGLVYGVKNVVSLTNPMPGAANYCPEWSPRDGRGPSDDLQEQAAATPSAPGVAGAAPEPASAAGYHGDEFMFDDAYGSEPSDMQLVYKASAVRVWTGQMTIPPASNGTPFRDGWMEVIDFGSTGPSIEQVQWGTVRDRPVLEPRMMTLKFYEPAEPHHDRY